MRAILVVLLCLGLTGCASVTAYRLPNANLEDFGSTYVVHFKADKRHLERTIADELVARGYNATYGEEQDTPENIDTVVTYVDHWFWDLRNYMLDITIEIRRAKDKTLIASGKSLRTSLVSASPEKMIQETLNKILKQK